MGDEKMGKTMILWKKRPMSARYGFTLIEIIVVVVILAIAAMLAVPMLSTAADTQLRTAGNMIAADMEYARSMAISRQQNYSVVFSSANNSYEVQDLGGNVLAHPLNSSSSLSVVFGDDSRLEDVDITSVNFDGVADQTITFDYLGSPFSGFAGVTALTIGTIDLQADGFTMTITVEPVTGYVTIQ